MFTYLNYKYIMSTEKRNDEIDLIEVTQKAGKALERATVGLIQLIVSFLKGSIKWGLNFLRFSIRYSYIIFSIALLCFFGGLYLSKSQKPYYRTSAVIQSNTISNSNLINYINRLHTLLDNADSTSLAKVLDIPVHEASKVIDLQAFWMIDKNKDGIADEIDYDNAFVPDSISDAVRITDRFHVELLTFDPSISPDIQGKLDAYLKTYPRLEQISEIKKQNLSNEITRINAEIKILDSLKNYEYFVKEKELKEYDKNTVKLNQLMLSSSEEPVQPTRLLHENILNLFDQNLNNYRALELETEPFVFLSKFIEVTNPVNINKETHMSIKLGLLGLVIGYLISLTVKYRKEISLFVKES